MTETVELDMPLADFVEKMREVFARRFPMCRDCADSGPICPTQRLPCDMSAHFDALSALTRSDPAVRDRVKPLEWGKTSYGTPEAISVVGVYRINSAMNGGFTVVFGGLRGRALSGPDGRTNFADEGAAKIAAQADYEQRILSALEPLTAPVRDRVADEASMSDAARWVIENYGRDTPVDALAMTLFEAWCEAEPTSDPATYPASYLATFSDMARAALRTSPPEPASGWVMVPVIPTVAMRDAGRDVAGPRKHLSVTNVYQAMLDAAPTPPAKEPQ